MLQFICFLGSHKILTTVFVVSLMVVVGIQRGTFKFEKED